MPDYQAIFSRLLAWPKTIAYSVYGGKVHLGNSPNIKGACHSGGAGDKQLN
jgi:hypothetical protein